MITIHQIIDEEFIDSKSDKIISILSNHNLYSVIDKSIGIVNTHLACKNKEIKEYGSIQIYHISSSLLVRINEYLKSLTDTNQDEEKKQLEYLLGCIIQRFLIKIIEELPHKQKILFSESLYRVLQETCLLFNYSFEELIDFLGIENIINEKLAANIEDKIAIPKDLNRIPGFSIESPIDVPIFMKIVEDFNITKDLDNFQKLFENPEDNLAIELNENKPDFVLQFFACLKMAKIVSYHSCKGFYEVLQYHVKGFNEVYLKGKNPYRRVETIKNHKTWPSNQNKFENRFIDLQ